MPETNYNDVQMTLPCMTLDDWASFYSVDHIDFMWLDMEGAEYYMLSASPKILQTTKVILSEINFKSFREGHTLYDTLKPFLEEIIDEKYRYNYQLFVESDTQNVKAVLITMTKLKKNDDKTKYLCMPINNQELYDKYKTATNNLGVTRVNMGFYLDVSYFSLVSKIVDDRYNYKIIP